HHVGARGPQGRRPVVRAADEGAHRKPALQEQAGHGSPDGPELTGGPGDEDRSVSGHATSLPFAERLIRPPGVTRYFHRALTPGAVLRAPAFNLASRSSGINKYNMF